MPLRSTLEQWERRHPDLAELGAGMTAAVAVVGLALVQWGITDEAWARGTLLGLGMGIVVAFSVRQGHRREDTRRRADREQQLRLARELHDAVASQVAIIGIQAAAARAVLRDQATPAGNTLEVIESAARAANADLRRMLAALRAEGAADGTASPDRGSPSLAELPELVHEVRAAGLQIEVAGIESLPPLPAPVDAAAYRIVQEALANALAHAGAVKATLSIAATDDVLRVEVENEPGSRVLPYRGSGLGLRGMRERAERLGGRVEAGRRPGGRFGVVATLPMETRNR